MLPQAVTRVLPALATTWVSLFKDTSLVSVIAVADLSYVALRLRAESYRILEVLTAMAVLYWLMGYPQAKLVRLDPSPLSGRRVSARVGADRRPLLVCEAVVKDYGTQRALDGISLAVHPGEVVCLIGPSGSGKSTLLRCINGLERIDGGAVLFEGRAVLSGSRAVREVRRRLGMVFQNFELFPHLTAHGQRHHRAAHRPRHRP